MSSHRDEEHARTDEQRIYIANMGPGEVALFRDLADASAKATAREMFIAMGLDPDQPLVSQRYFQTLRRLTERAEDDTADAAWVRRWRPRTEGLFGKVATVIIGASVLGAMSTWWTGLKAAVTALPTPPH